MIVPFVNVVKEKADHPAFKYQEYGVDEIVPHVMDPQINSAGFSKAHQEQVSNKAFPDQALISRKTEERGQEADHFCNGIYTQVQWHLVLQ